MSALNPGGPAMIRRRSRIAQLPEAIRNQVNELIESSTPYRQICDFLTQQGHPGFDEDVISRWKNGGFLDWYKAQERLQEMEYKRPDALKLVQSDARAFIEANEDMTEVLFYDALNRADSAALSEMVNSNPREFIALLKTFTHFRRYRLHRDRFHEYLRQQRRLEERENKLPRTGGVRPETFTTAQEILTT